MVQNPDFSVIPYGLIEVSDCFDGETDVVLLSRQTRFRIIISSLPNYLGLLCRPFFIQCAQIYRQDLESHLRNPEILLKLTCEEAEGQPQLLDLPITQTLSPLPRYMLSMAIVTRMKLQRHIYEVEINGTEFPSPVSLRVPKLEGFIGLDTESPGLLMTKVRHRMRLCDIGIEQADVAKRLKWYARIKSAIEILHGIDIVWDDVKAHNILINEQDNCWIIDFGGGNTEGWVSENLQETREGDLEGLENLRRFLQVELQLQ
ncbi:hypothetical protein BDW69DRAFT_199342 [Aspergillus filifer]